MPKFSCLAYSIIQGRYRCLFAAMLPRSDPPDIRASLHYPGQHCVASCIQEGLTTIGHSPESLCSRWGLIPKYALPLSLSCFVS